MNRLEIGTPEALRIESYDQAATAIAALHAGWQFPPLSLRQKRENGWRFRDGVFERLPDQGNEVADVSVFSVVFGAGSAAQLISLNVEHPAEVLVRSIGEVDGGIG